MLLKDVIQVKLAAFYILLFDIRAWALLTYEAIECFWERPIVNTSTERKLRFAAYFY